MCALFSASTLVSRSGSTLTRTVFRSNTAVYRRVMCTRADAAGTKRAAATVVVASATRRRLIPGSLPETRTARSRAELAGRRRRGRRRGGRRGGGRGRGYRGRRGGRRGDDGCGPGSGNGGRRRGGGRRRARRVRVARTVGVGPGSVLGRSGPATRARTPAGPAWTRPVAVLRASLRPSWARAPVRDGMPGRDAGHGARVRGHGPGVQRGVPRRGGTARPQEDEAQGGEDRERAPDVPPAHPIHPPPRGSPTPILPS